MAKDLNKTRIRDSKMIMFTVLLLAFFSNTLIGYESAWHGIVEFLGYFLIAVCALGRLYATAFLGGHKNSTLITYGAFSIVRNPLYFFSLLGMTGVALISGHIVVMIVLPSAFFIMYHFLIMREEGFLKQEFGADYEAYMEAVPRLMPNFSLYNAPKNIKMAPEFLKKAFFDALWWFVAFPVYELSEMLQESGLIKPLFMLP